MKYSYHDEFLSQFFTFYPDHIEDAFGVTVIGSPTDMALFDMMLRANGLSHCVFSKEDMDHDN